jgi:hypothetical protein
MKSNINTYRRQLAEISQLARLEAERKRAIDLIRKVFSAVEDVPR